MIASAHRSASAFALCSALLVGAASSALAAPGAPYPQVDASSQEQYLLERINAARANPAAEGAMLAGVQDSEILRYYSHYGVDANKLRADFNGYAAQPPLAFNARLMASAREHSLDQATKGFQGHDGSDGSHFDGRIIAQGYQWRALGENVFAYVQNPFFGHVGLNADWGVPDLGHRENIMNTDPKFPTYKEVGISCVATSVKGFGPLVVTQDFGAPSDGSAAYLVGVVYDDRNGNGAYDEGEGLGGVSVTPSGGDFYALTTASGGYTLPLPKGAGSWTLTAAGGSLGAPRAQQVSFAGATNAKADFTSQQQSGAAPAQQPAALPEVTITAAAATADGAQPGVILIQRKGSKSQALEVALSVGGTAVGGVDYSALPSTVSIPAGARSIRLSVNPLSAEFAGVKKVKVKAAPATNYTLGASAKANVNLLGNY